MTARTHDLIAFAALTSAAVYYHPQNINLYTLFASVIGCTVGSLIPDADQAGNRLWDLLPGGDYVSRILRRVFYKHRTITHSLLGTYLLYKGLEWLLPKIFNAGFVDHKILLISVMIGFVSHLLADSLTEEGVPLLFPIGINFGFPPIRSWRIKTGKWFENLVVLPGVVLYLVWLIGSYKDPLLKLLRSVN